MSAPTDVLLVDDDELDRELVRRLLPRETPVREAATAEEARVHLDRAVPGLVFLDNRLPDADGVDLLPLFVERHVPVVMLTEIGASEVIVVAMQRGAQDYLVKGSLTREGVRRTIENAVEKGALRKRLHEQHLALAEQARTLEARNQEVRALASALTLAEQAERRRIAEVLHDHVQQLIVGAQIHLQMSQRDGAAADGRLVDRALEILDEAVRSTRELAVELTPPVFEDDLEGALRWLADHMSRFYHVVVDVSAETPGEVPSRDLRVLLVQIVRELVFNAVKHAGVEHVRVRLSEEGAKLVVTVEDEGRGFDAAAAERHPSRGFGLNSVRERLGLVGGTLEVASRIGQGTRATVTVSA